MARAVIENKLKRQPSGMPDSWKRGKTNKNNLSKAQSIRREDDVGGVLESTPQVTEREIGSGATTTIRGFEETVSSNVQPAEKKRRVSSPGQAKVQLKIATNNFLSQLSSTHLSEEDIFKLGLVCLKERKKKHTDSGYQGSFWGNISTRISELHQDSTGSSENQQVQS